MHPVHGMFFNKLDSEVDHLVKEATREDIRRNFIPTLTALVKGARALTLSDDDVKQATRALVNLNTYFQDSRHWKEVWTSDVVKEAWRQLWLADDLPNTKPPSEWFDTERPTLGHLDSALELWFRCEYSENSTQQPLLTIIRLIHLLDSDPRTSPIGIPSISPQRLSSFRHRLQDQTQLRPPNLGPRHQLARNKSLPLLRPQHPASLHSKLPPRSHASKLHAHPPPCRPHPPLRRLFQSRLGNRNRYITRHSRESQSFQEED